MRIKDIEAVQCEFITTNEEEQNEYKRYSADSWEIRMGDSWESLYYYEEIESLYQEFVKKKSALEMTDGEPGRKEPKI